MLDVCRSGLHVAIGRPTPAPALLEQGRHSVDGGDLCPLTLFPEVDAVMVGIPKNAGSTLMAVLRRALGDWRRARLVGHEVYVVSNGTQLTATRKSWSSLLKFVFVRNPFTRAASMHGYLDRVSKGGAFGSFCLDPLRYLCRGKADRFCNFGKGQTLDVFQRHLVAQSGCVFGPDGQIAVNFVGRVDSLQADLTALLKLVGENTSRNSSISRRIAAVAAIPIGSKNRNPKAGIAGTNTATGGDPSYQRLYAQHPHCCGEVEKWYSADVKAFRCAPTAQRTSITFTQPCVRWANT